MNRSLSRLSAVLLSAVFLLGTQVTPAQEQAVSEPDQPDMGTLEFEGEVAVLPLTSESGHPRVWVDLGDGEQYAFVVDTGAEVNVMDAAIAKRLGYEVTGEMDIGAPGGPQITGGIVRVPEVKISDTTIRNAEFVTMDIDGFSMGIMQGVIGLGLFKDVTLTYDQSNQQLRVNRGELSADAAGAMAFTNASGHIQIELDVAGYKLPTHVDTGAMGNWLIPIELLEKLPLKGEPVAGPRARLVGGERELKLAQLDGEIQFGGFRISDPQLAFMSPTTGYGNLGMGVMRDMVVAVDQRNSLISFTRAAGNHVQASAGGPVRMMRRGGPGGAVMANPSERRQIGLAFMGMNDPGNLRVDTVIPGSLAEKAGFKAGDRLTTMNGRDLSDYSMADLGQLFGSSTPLVIEVQRDGDTRTLEIE